MRAERGRGFRFRDPEDRRGEDWRAGAGIAECQNLMFERLFAFSEMVFFLLRVCVIWALIDLAA